MKTLKSLLLVVVASVGLASNASAVQIAVTNYGTSPPGFPALIALEKGFFKEAGADVTGIISGTGGGNTVRLAVTGDVAYGEANLASVLGAIQQGAELTIVSQPTNNAGYSWLVMPNSPIKSFADLKGKTIGYSAPQSLSQAYELWLLKKFGYKPDDVKMIATNGDANGLVLLEHGGIDVGVVSEAVDHSNYRVILQATDRSIVPDANNTVGFVQTAYLKAHPDVVKAIIAGRRKAAIFLREHPKESAEIVAKNFKMKQDFVQDLIVEMTKTSSPAAPSLSEGKFNLKALETSLEFARLIGTIKGDVDLRNHIDEQYLPADLQGGLK